eukprot:TRINITY_DN13305_c0_g1_i1.p1 TRINITY_DN13305_c0_g1~~TRINITY_DN13305_c0_g1_i1.p1  ORF type:complete len:1153 (+),score=225.93 TRINITY_DN13305_c0_g1_i1:34-3459(+)
MADEISMKRVLYEVQIIQTVCGPSSDHPLTSINFDVDYTFESGVRVPPWRAKLGELCVLIVDTKDVGRVCITAAKKGYFRNNGHTIDPSGTETLDYGQKGNVHATLSECIKEHSSHYTGLITLPADYWNDWQLEVKPELPDAKKLQEATQFSSASELLDLPGKKKGRSKGSTTSGRSKGSKRDATVPKRPDTADAPARVRRGSLTMQRPEGSPAWESMRVAELDAKIDSGAVDAPLRQRSLTQRSNSSVNLSGRLARRDSSGSLHSTSPQQLSARSDSSAVPSLPLSSVPRVADKQLSDQRGGGVSPLIRSVFDKQASPRSGDVPARMHRTGSVNSFRSQDGQSPQILQQLRAEAAARRDVQPGATPSPELPSSDTRRGTMTAAAIKESLAVFSARFNHRLAAQRKQGLLSVPHQATGRTSMLLGMSGIESRPSILSDMTSTPMQPLAAPAEKKTPPSSAKNSARPKTAPAATKPVAKKTAMQEAQEDEEDDEKFDSELAIEPPIKPSEYTDRHIHIHKLAKMLLTEGYVVPALTSVLELDLDTTAVHVAMRDVGCIEPLVKLLDSNQAHVRLKIVQVLTHVAKNPANQIIIRQLDGIVPLVERLQDDNPISRAAVAHTLALLAQNARNRRQIMLAGGVKDLVQILFTEKDQSVLVGAATALWHTCKYDKAQKQVFELKALDRIQRHMDRSTDEFTLPLLGTLRWLASNENAAHHFDAQDIPDMVIGKLKSDNTAILSEAANALQFILRDKTGPGILQEKKGSLQRLVQLLKLASTGTQDFITGVLGSLFQGTQLAENATQTVKMDATASVVPLLGHQEEEVQHLAAAVLSNLCQSEQGRKAVKSSSGLLPLVSLLTSTNLDVLVHVCNALYYACLATDNMKVVTDNDGIRLLWSLLKSRSQRVQAAAARAIMPCIDEPNNAASVRWLVGGLPLLVNLLDSDNEDVQAYVCGSVANIAKDEQNLAVITEYGVVKKLGALVQTTNDNVRKYLSAAIARCAPVPENRRILGDDQAIRPIVDFLKSGDVEVHRTTAQALMALTDDAANAADAREAGAVGLLVTLMKSTDHSMQEAAAGAIANIRKYHLVTMEQITTARSRSGTPRGASRTPLGMAMQLQSAQTTTRSVSRSGLSQLSARQSVLV